MSPIHRLFVLCLFLSPCLAIGQVTPAGDFNVRTGEPFPSIESKDRYYFPFGENVIAVKIDGKHWHIQRFSSVKLAQASVQEYEDMPDDLVIEWMGKFNERLYVLYSSEEKKPKEQRLYYREIDPASGTFKGAGALALTVPGRLRGETFTMRSGMTRLEQRFYVVLSPGKEKMMVRYEHDDTKEITAPKGNDLGVAVFGEDMVKEWEGELAFPADAGRVRGENYAVDAKGQVYLMGFHMLDPGDPSKVPTRENVLGRFGTDGVKWTVFPEVPGISTSAGLLVFGQRGGGVGFAGFCKQQPDALMKDALCMLEVTSDGAVHPRTIPIPAGTIDLRIGVGEDEKLKKGFQFPGMADLLMQRVRPLPDGGYLISGEKYYEASELHVESNGRGGSIDVRVYIDHYEEALLMSVRPDGVVAWASVLPKVVGPGSAYASANGAHLYFYATDPKAVKMPLTTKAKDWRDMRDPRLFAYSVDQGNGELMEHSIADIPDISDVYFNDVEWDRVVNMGEGRLIIETGAGKNEVKLMEVSLK
jgi:hypothetical protein